MPHKLSLRQYKRLLGISNEEQLAQVLNGFEALASTDNVSEDLRPALKGMRQFFSQVDEAYHQADRDLALGKLSMELSSDELHEANQTLRAEAEKRQHVLNTLRHTTNEVLSQLGKRLADEDSLEELSHLLAGLVSELLTTRSSLEHALADVRNQQFALDQHAIVSITDASGVLIYANDKFCEISHYSREQLLGQNHRIVNSGLHSDEFFRNMWETISSGQVWHGEIRNQARDRSFYWTNASIVPFLDAQNKPYQYISIRTDITQQRQLKEEIESSKALLQNVMNTLGEGVYTLDAAGRCTFLNPEAEKILGWTLAEVRGKVLHDVVHSVKQDGVHVHVEACEISQRMQAGQVYRSEDETFRHKSGAYFPISIVASPIFENGNIVGSVAAFQDVTARHAAEAALGQSETKQRMMLDNAADAVFVADRSERWVYVNDLAATMLGYAREELVGMSIYDALPEQHRESARKNAMKSLLREKLVRQEIVLRRKDGQRLPVEMNAALLPDGSIYGSCRDITDRKVFEAALIRAKEGAEAASKAKSEFLATMSHEIRTPMNGIIGMTELALDTELAPDQREYLELVKISSHSLLDIINDILDFSKIESGKLVLEKIEFPLRDLIATTLKTLALRAAEKGLELVYQIDAAIPNVLLGDPGRVRQVLTNLLGNAIKFSEQGVIALNVRLASVPTQGATQAQDKQVGVVFSVSDNGIGIPLEKQRAIFDPFSQADASTTRKYGGTGLGLSISSRLVEGMQGQLQVQSEVGKGSTFYFTGWFEVAQKQSLAVSKFDLRGLHVLVVDDNPINRHFFVDTLHQWKMHTSTAESAAQALVLCEQARADGRAFDLVLLDACMPHVDGFTLAQQLMVQGVMRGAQILMLSSADGIDDAQRCKEIGLAGYVKKPVSQQELQLAMESALSGNSQAALHYTDLEANYPSQEKSKLSILVAEDNVINQKLALSLLKKWQHSADIAENGLLAVSMFQAKEYDLILMDMQMPEMGGIEATEKIRELENGLAHIPIIAMTANAMPGDRERCLAAGMDHYLSKPLKPELLKELLEHYFLQTSPIAAQATQHEKEATSPNRRVSDTSRSAFDYDAAIAQGDAEILQIISPLFLEGYQKQLQELADSIAQLDFDTMYRSAHTLKGLVGNFNATPVEELSRAIEVKGKQKDSSRVTLIFEELNKQIEPMIAALQRYVAAMPAGDET